MLLDRLDAPDVVELTFDFDFFPWKLPPKNYFFVYKKAPYEGAEFSNLYDSQLIFVLVS